MLSRRIVRGNFTTTAKPTTVDEIKELKITHRHRWYRIIGVDANPMAENGELMGEPWDYPEMNSVMRPGGAYVGFVPSTGSQAKSVDVFRLSPGWTNGMVANGNLSLIDLTTTATIFKNVVAVHKRNVTIE